MAWERRGHQRSYYYRVTRDRTGCLRKRYYGMGLAAQRAFQEDLQQRAIRTQLRAERQHLQTLDVQRDVQALRQQLLGPHPTPLESVLVDRICICWLALQHAEMVTAKRLTPQSCLLSQAEEHRLDRLQHRFLAAVRELARVRQLL